VLFHQIKFVILLQMEMRRLRLSSTKTMRLRTLSKGAAGVIFTVPASEVYCFMAKKLAQEHNAVLRTISHDADDPLARAYTAEKKHDKVYVLEFSSSGPLKLDPKYTFIQWDWKNFEKGERYVTVCVKN
jgi:hypothetical protein